MGELQIPRLADEIDLLEAEREELINTIMQNRAVSVLDSGEKLQKINSLYDGLVERVSDRIIELRDALEYHEAMGEN